MTNNARKQGVGRGGVAPPKEYQFGQPNGNPRHKGAWRKEDTARFKLEQMMKLTEAELLAVASDQSAPYFERKLAKCINAGQWKELEGMINQVYGYPNSDVRLSGQMEVAKHNPLFDLSVEELRRLKELKIAAEKPNKNAEMHAKTRVLPQKRSVSGKEETEQ